MVVLTFYNSTASHTSSTLLTSSNAVSVPTKSEERDNPHRKVFDTWLRVGDPSTWNVGSYLSATFTPAATVFNNATILKHMAGYSHYKFDLEVEVLFAPSAYHSGVVVVSWHPIANTTAVAYSTCIPVHSGNDVSFRRMQCSQKYGTMINLSTDHTARLTIPFIYPTERMAIATTANANGYGCLQVESLTSLRDVSANRNLTYSVRVRAINVELTGKSIILQSDTAFDSPYELHSSVIKSVSEYVAEGSNIISTVGAVAGAALGQPEVSAAAASMGDLGAGLAESMRDVAHLAEQFGFSNDISTAPPTSIYPTLSPALWSSDVSCPIPYFGVAPKSTMATVGEGEDATDPLNIRSLCCHPSYIGTIEMNTPTATGTVIFDAYVTPGYSRYGTRTGSAALTYTTLVDTPSRYVANLFSSWRGTVCYKFILANTPYTKGSARICYSHSPALPTVTPALDPLIAPVEWDFSKSSSVVVKVPMSGSSDYLRCVPSYSDGLFLSGTNFPGRVTTFSCYSATSLPAITAAYSPYFYNGRITVQVGNVAFNGTDDDVISIAVVTWLEDADFAHIIADPTTGVGLDDPYDLHSATETAEVDVNPDAPIPSQPIYLSEKVESLRPLILKGYLADYWVPVDTSADDSGLVSVRYRTYLWPPGHGACAPATVGRLRCNQTYVKQKMDGSGSSTNQLYHFQPNLPFHWIAGMFLGWRGSLNWKFFPIYSHRYNTDFTNAGPDDTYVTIGPELLYNGLFTGVHHLKDSSSAWTVMSDVFGSDREVTPDFSSHRATKVGVDVSGKVHGATSLSAPYPSLDRFLPCSSNFFKRSDVYDVNTPIPHVYSARLTNYLIYHYSTYRLTSTTPATITPTEANVSCYFSAGTDMNFFHFIATPIVYVNYLPGGISQDPPPLN